MLDILRDMVETHLYRVRPLLQVDPEPSRPFVLRPGWAVPDLLSAMWLQFYWFLTSEKTLNRCLECHSLFVPTRSNQQFCPPFRGQKQSSCANRYYVRQHRERQKERENG
ncbi:MAG: hypothetical protein AB1510_01495 [Bacillota bacterium]